MTTSHFLKTTLLLPLGVLVLGMSSNAATLKPLTGNLNLLNSKEAKELSLLKEKAQDTGFNIPSHDALKLSAFTLRTALFNGTEWPEQELEAALQRSHDKIEKIAHDEWTDSGKNLKGTFEGIKLTSVSKSGFKVILDQNASHQDIQKAQDLLEKELMPKEGVCRVITQGIELRMICLNLAYRRITQEEVPVVKTISHTIRGETTNAGNMVCTKSGCGTYKTGAVKQLDATSSKKVLTGKTTQETRTRTFNDRVELPSLDQINLF